MKLTLYKVELKFVFLFPGDKNDAASSVLFNHKTSLAELYSTRIEIDDIVKHESCRDGSFRLDKI